jgi:uncharacterized membrane protein
MGVGSGVYRFVLLLHITAVVVGFGTLMLNGVYARLADKRGGAEGVAINEANAAVSQQWALPFVYAVPVLGIALVLLSDDEWGFDQLWITLSFVVFIVGVGLAIEMKRARGRMKERSADHVRLGRKVAALGGALNVAVVVAIALMVWKPGV